MKEGAKESGFEGGLRADKAGVRSEFDFVLTLKGI